MIVAALGIAGGLGTACGEPGEDGADGGTPEAAPDVVPPFDDGSAGDGTVPDDGGRDSAVDVSTDRDAADALPSCNDYGPTGRAVSAARLAKIQTWSVNQRIPLDKRPLDLLAHGSRLFASTWFPAGGEKVDHLIAFDRVTLAEVQRVAADAPSDLALVGGTLYALQTFSDTIAAFDPTTLAARPSIAIPGTPVSSATNLTAIPNSNSLFFSTSRTHKAYVIDATTGLRTEHPFPNAPNGSPYTPTAFVDPRTNHRLVAFSVVSAGNPHVRQLDVFDVDTGSYPVAIPFPSDNGWVSSAAPSGDGCRLYVGMFQDDVGLRVLDPAQGYGTVQSFPSPTRAGNPFTWPNVGAVRTYEDLLLVVERSNGRLVVRNRFTGALLRTIDLVDGPAPGNPNILMDGATMIVLDGRIVIGSTDPRELIVIDAPL